MKLTKKKIIAIISSVVMIATLICAMAMISSAATFELPDEGMSFQRDTVYQMYENLTVSEDLTIETEFWINPAPNDNTRYGAMISNVVTNPSSSQKQYMLEMYSFGRLRFWTDDVNYYLFNYDIRTAVTQSKFVKAAITVDVYTTATTVTQADGTTVTAYGAVSLYIDGEYKETVYATSKKFVPGWFSTSTPLCIGGDKRDNNPYSFMGAIKNVTLYSDVRTAEEIKTSYQATTYSESFDASDDALLVAYDLTADMFYDDLSQNGNNLRFISPEGKSFTAEENQLYLDKPLTETPRTYEAVIYAPTEAGSERTGVILGNYDWTSSGELRCLNFEIFDNGAPSLYIKDSTGVSKPRFKSSSSKVIREGWVHLVIVDDGTKYYCYIDGELTETITHKAASGVDSYEYDISSVQADTTLSIAQDTRPEKLFKGKIKYIAYYSEPLTAEEIKTSYE